MSELTWVTCHDWLETKELKRMNWTKWMTWIYSHEWSDMNEVNWNECSETNELKEIIWRLYLQKVVRCCQFFFTIFMWNRALATVSCAFCRPLSGSSRETAETETLQRQPRTATLPEETQGFAPESVFSREFTRSRSLTLLNYLMMWLTWWLRWWCGCHTGETASHWQSSVTRKFPK